MTENATNNNQQTGAPPQATSDNATGTGSNNGPVYLNEAHAAQLRQMAQNHQMGQQYLQDLHMDALLSQQQTPQWAQQHMQNLHARSQFWLKQQHWQGQQSVQQLHQHVMQLLHQEGQVTPADRTRIHNMEQVRDWQMKHIGEMSDGDLQRTINDLLDDDPLTADADVTAFVQDKRVTLSGTVKNKRVKREAAMLAWTTPGVTDVFNNIIITGRSAQQHKALEAKHGEATYNKG